MKTVDIQYFAVFREQAGCSGETRTSGASTFSELYAECAAAHGFTLPEDRVRAAVDSNYVPMAEPLGDSGVITFIPPMAGG